MKAAENGATAHQLMALFGWTKITQAEPYTKAAEQKALAAAIMPALKGGPTFNLRGTFWVKIQTIQMRFSVVVPWPESKSAANLLI